MKRMHLFSLALAGVLGATANSSAQDTAALLAADRQENEERFKTLNAKIDQLVEANETYLKKINRLTGEMDKMKEEVERSKNDAIKDTLKRLEDAIQEVDKKHVANNKMILAELAKLGKEVAVPPPSTNSAKPGGGVGATPPRLPAAGEKGYEYVVKSGDTGGTILQFYRDQGVKITLRQLIEANPNVNWNKLKINQKIFVPIPDK